MSKTAPTWAQSGGYGRGPISIRRTKLEALCLGEESYRGNLWQATYWSLPNLKLMRS